MKGSLLVDLLNIYIMHNIPLSPAWSLGICLDNFMHYRTKTEAADQTFSSYLQYTDTRPTSPSWPCDGRVSH